MFAKKRPYTAGSLLVCAASPGSPNPAPGQNEKPAAMITAPQLPAATGLQR